MRRIPRRVTPDQYSEQCRKLISQFKSTESALVASGAIQSATEFMQTHQISFPRARDFDQDGGAFYGDSFCSRRLWHGHLCPSDTTLSRLWMLDSNRAVDDIKPLLSRYAALGKVPSLPANFEGSVKMTLWLRLNQMRAGRDYGG